MPDRRPRIVLTGGPCAGKTTLTEVIARVFANRVAVVPEAASLLFSGGFPRWPEPECRRSSQRAIYRVQLELEADFSARYPQRVLVLDRGTVDGAAYWPDGPEAYFAALGTSLATELARYDRVIYLESADREAYEASRTKNLNRRETWEEAMALDALTLEQWRRHAALKVVRNRRSFSDKILEVMGTIEADLAR
jgi:nicotinamide riboside kinase